MSGDVSDGYERLNPLILVSLSSVSTNLISVSVVETLEVYFTLSVSGTAKRGLSMTFDSSLGERSIKSYTVPFLGSKAFFLRTCFLVSSMYLGDPSIRKENNRLLAILSIIVLPCSPSGSFLQTSSVNTEACEIFLTRIP